MKRTLAVMVLGLLVVSIAHADVPPPKGSKRVTLDNKITTEKEWNDGETHGVWFNRGAIAGQKFAEEFGNKPPQNINDPNDPTVNGCRADCSRLALNISPRPKPAMRCASPPMSSPTRRS